MLPHQAIKSSRPAGLRFSSPVPRSTIWGLVAAQPLLDALITIMRKPQPTLVTCPPAGSATYRSWCVIGCHKPVIHYKPQSASLQPTNPGASLPVSPVTVFNLLFVGEVVYFSVSWQRAATAAEAPFSGFWESLSFCTPVTGAEISQLLPDVQSVSGCARLGRWAGRSRAGPHGRERLVFSSSLPLCMTWGAFM